MGNPIYPGRAVRVARQANSVTANLMCAGNSFTRVPTPQGKQGKWSKKIPVRENPCREFGNFAKTQNSHGYWHITRSQIGL